MPVSFERSDSSGAHADMGNIYNNLKDLEFGKSVLHRDYEKLLEEHRLAEDKVEKARAFTSEASGRFMKAQENLNISKMKLDSLTSSILSSETCCQGLRERITSLQDKLRGEKQQQVDNLNSFESEIEDLKKNFVNAIIGYADKQLESSIAIQEMQYEDIIQQCNELEEQIGNAEHNLRSLSGLTPTADPWQEIVPNVQREFLMKILLEERNKFERTVSDLQQNKTKINLVLKQQNMQLQDV